MDENQTLVEIRCSSGVKNGEQRVVNSFEEVTVLFPDLVGFTSLATQTAPSALIQLLDQVLSAFDELADLHGVEKIKTTGDAYMAAAGVPFPHRDHAFAAARMSLGMQSGVSA
jgi:adenylate cyclase